MEPGGSCTFGSVRGTIEVPYEDLGKFDLFHFVLGALVLAVVVWFAVDAVRDLWRRRNRET